MKSLLVSTLVAAGLLASAPAFASKDLAQSKGCLACTAADEAKLIEKVKKGGSGVWGAIPMPPQPALKDEDVKTLVKWIMAGAK